MKVHPRYVRPETEAPAAGNNGKRPHLILPSANVSILECSVNTFQALAKTHKYFVRGRLITEIGRDKDNNETLLAVRPSGLRTRIEEHFALWAWRVGKDAGLVLKPALCPKDVAEAILDSNPAVDLLPGIRLMANSPIITEADSQLKILERGYNSALGGVYVLRHLKIPDVSIDDATRAIINLMADFDFVTKSDLSRAVASVISPALRFGGLISGDSPLDIGEADFSQSGKTFRQKMVCAIYGETAYVIARREGGVGSPDESLAHAIVSARPFVALDNMRGEVDSQLLESALRGHGVVNCRIPYRGEIQLGINHICWQLSSNRASATRDLANRSIIVRLRKRPAVYEYRAYREGDLISHIGKNQAHYLGCVFAIVRHWFDAGKLRTAETRHDFREWAQTLDWIIQNIFHLPPLLDGHREEQERISDPILNWLRDIVVHVNRMQRLDEKFRPAEIADICEECAIDIPGCRVGLSEDQVQMVVGKNLRRLFRDANTRCVDGILVRHSIEQEYIAREQRNKAVNFYEFCQPE